ncbi:MAG: PKD domain-containing protein [Kiritimatiellae bacterium]|nr:PKD domain-containing protein [Kiritimatiellia bacterium]
MLAAAALLAATCAQADTIHVAPNGSDPNGDGSQGAPFASLAAAVDAAQDGDSVAIAAGTYETTERIVVTKALDIAGDDTDPSQVVFDGQDKYLLLAVGNDGALVHGITFQNGHDNSNGSATALTGHPDNYYKGAPIEMNAGTFSNCVVKSGWGRFNGSMAIWGTAKVFDCFFSGGYNYDGNPANAGRGGCLKLGGDSVAGRCVFTGGSAGGGGGVGIGNNALVFDSIITNNTCRNSDNMSYGGGGVFFITGGALSNCVVKANTTPNGYAGGIYLGPGKVYNTLVAGNSASHAGGVFMHNGNGRLYNCTIADNTAAGIGQDIFRDSNAQTVNTIVAGDYRSSAGTDVNGCIGGDPGFRDAANGDYTLDAASICIDGGSDLAWGNGATDASLSTARVIDGDGDGVAKVDIGAYEYDPATAPVGCSFRIDAPSVAAYPMSVPFSPTLSGAYGEVTSVAWDFGDGTTESGAAMAATPHPYAAPGSYTVTLTVVTTLGGTLTATKTALLKGTDVYVSTAGSNTAPYATPETAARSLTVALSCIGTPATGRAVVHIADGTYQPTEKLAIVSPVEIAGNDDDPSKVVFDGQNNNKLLSIGSAGVLVHGITFENGKGDNSGLLTGYPNFFQGCSLEMNAGTLSNCVVKSGRASYSGNLSAWGTAEIYDCVFTGGYNPDGTASNAARGGNIKIAGNAVAGRCIITGGSAVCGAGATVEGNALLFDSVITNNTSRSDNSRAGGGGVNIAGGTVSNCVIAANSTEYTTSSLTGDNAKGGGGVRLQSGKLFGCLVYGNTAKDGAGVFQLNGAVENCTIANNTATGEYGFYQTAGTAKNTISADLRVGGTVTCSCSPDLTDGENGNVNVADVSLYFRDVSENDYTLKASSPAIDAGDAAAGAESGFDLAGTARVIDGDGDGTAKIDMGCYEYDPAAIGTQVSFNFSIARYEAFADTRVVFEPAIEGQYGEVTSVAWNFGDGQTSSPAALATAANDYAAAGTYTVTLTVETTLGGTLAASRDVSFKPLVTYVAPEGTGSATAPYDTAARATATLADAIEALGEPLAGRSVVIIADGTYPAPDSAISISKGVELRGNDADPSAVTFDGENARRFFIVTNSAAFVHGMKFYRGYVSGGETDGASAKYSQATVGVGAGVVSNCVFDGCRGKYAGSVALWNTGALVDSIVANGNVADGNGAIAGRGGAVKMWNNSVVRGCTFTNNTAVQAGAVFMGGGLMEDCVLTGNSAINGNSGGRGGAVRAENATVRNCLIYGNSAYSAGGGVYLWGGSTLLESSTVADNSASDNGGDVYVENGIVKNAIVYDALSDYDSAKPPLYKAAGTVTYTCSPSLTDGADGNISAAPLFKNAADGNYAIKSSSPCVNAGQFAEWMTGAKDLAGNNRIIKSVVDMGCYEAPAALPLVILVR